MCIGLPRNRDMCPICRYVNTNPQNRDFVPVFQDIRQPLTCIERDSVPPYPQFPVSTLEGDSGTYKPVYIGIQLTFPKFCANFIKRLFSKAAEKPIQFVWQATALAQLVGYWFFKKRTRRGRMCKPQFHV